MDYINPQNEFHSSETTTYYTTNDMDRWNEYYLFVLDRYDIEINAHIIRVAAGMADAMLEQYLERAEPDNE